MYWIYIIVNKINYKKYVGYTSKDPIKRFKKQVSLKLKSDPTIYMRNRIAGILSHYKRGHKISNENFFLIRDII